MTHAWVDASSGVAGDMLLGALLDAGARLDAVRDAVDAVLAGAVHVAVEPVTRAGVRATKAEVRVLAPDQPARTWVDIRAMIAEAHIADPIRTNAQDVFAALAAAEGRVHGIAAEDVHFHEVGALDSMADVVGVCSALHDLGVTSMSAAPDVALGTGQVRTAHGTLPVPVPAVLQLARGWRVRAGGEGELTTPTGMALLSVLAGHQEELPTMVVRASGSGAGTRDIPGRPNTTRIVVGELQEPNTSAAPASTALLLEANVDDLDPRLWPSVLEGLLEAGADDAWLVPIVMKKGRPAHTLSVLCDPLLAERLRQLMMDTTSTIGVRSLDVAKSALPRVWFDVNVQGQPVSVKIAYTEGVIRQVTPEFDSVAARAAALGCTQRDALALAIASASAAGLVVGRPLPEEGTAPSTGS